MWVIFFPQHTIYIFCQRHYSTIKGYTARSFKKKDMQAAAFHPAVRFLGGFHKLSAMECGTFKAQAAHAKHSDPEVPGTAIREGEWEPQISFEIFDHCPKINLKKQTQTPNLRYTDQQVARAPRKDLENNRRPTQQPELESETERAKHGSNQLCYSTAAVSATVPRTVRCSELQYQTSRYSHPDSR